MKGLGDDGDEVWIRGMRFIIRVMRVAIHLQRPRKNRNFVGIETQLCQLDIFLRLGLGLGLE